MEWVTDDTGDAPRPLPPNAPYMPGRWHADEAWTALVAERDAARIEVERLRAGIAGLRRRHIWACDWLGSGPCNCGAIDQNAAIDALLGETP